MPHKKNANGRHHIPKMRHCVTNWREYEAGLRRRGSLTMWVTDEAMAAWAAAPRATPGGQAVYSERAIQTCLMLRAAFKLPLRQAERAAARADRQHGTEGLRRRRMAG